MQNGVSWYSEGIASFPVYFPEGEENCRHCSFCYYAEPFRVFRCRLTDAYIDPPDIDRRSVLCPITFQEV